MYIPITSEITLGIGTMVREISTGYLFTVAERVEHNENVLGEDTWQLAPVGAENPHRKPIVLTRQELSEKFFAEDGA